MDDQEGRNCDLLWSIYYDLRLNEPARELLRLQATKLLGLSTSSEQWLQSPYSRLKWCDSTTKSDVRAVWKLYASDPRTQEGQNFEIQLEDCLKKAKSMNERKRPPRAGPMTEHKRASAAFGTALQATLPAQSVVLAKPELLAFLEDYWWDHDCLELDHKKAAGAKYPNPTLYSTGILHYCTSPFAGFHLSRAFIPLRRDDPLAKELQGLSQREKIFTVARFECESILLGKIFRESN